MQSNAKIRNATQAGYLSKTYSDVKICLSVLPRFQFSIHLITQTLLLPLRSLQWPDCTLSTVRDYDYNVALRNRQVTQSIATQMSSQP